MAKKQGITEMKSKHLVFQKEADRTWGISEKKGERIGTLSFSLSPMKYTVTADIKLLSEEIEESKWKEILTLLPEIGLLEPHIHFVQYRPDLHKAWEEEFLKKIGFKREEKAEFSMYMVKEQGHTSWLSIYMCLGLAIGMTLGRGIGSIGAGLGIGMCFGMMIGAMLDTTGKKKRAEIAAERNQS